MNQDQKKVEEIESNRSEIVFVRAELETQNSSLRWSSKLEFKASELFEPFDYATFITNLVI